MPALIRLGPPAAAQAREHRLTDGLRTAAGATLLLAGFNTRPGPVRNPPGWALIAGGGVAGLPALRRLVPPGTLTGRPGLPATIASRGLLTFTFFGADAYVTLAVTAVRHRSPGGGLLRCHRRDGVPSWTVGAWVQARLSDTWEGRRLVRAGLLIVLVGIAGRALVPAACSSRWPRAWPPGPSRAWAWSAPKRSAVADDAAQGAARAGGAGLGVAEPGGRAGHRARHRRGRRGAAVAAGGDLRPGITAAFAVAAAVGLMALAFTRRLPEGTSSAPPVTEQVPARADPSG